MQRKMLVGKIHRATVTQTDRDYVGSITIDADLLAASGIMPNESVLVADIDNGARLETYVIEGARGSGVIGMNGAAANLINRGDKVIIIAFAWLDSSELAGHHAKVVVVDDNNRISRQMMY